MKLKGLILILFFFSGAIAKAAQANRPSVAEILQKVGNVYQNLHSYQIVARSEVMLTQTSNVSLGGSADSNGTPLETYIGNKKDETSQIELTAVDPNEVSLLVSSETVSGKIQVVSDGKTTWAFMSDKREYTEKPVSLNSRSDSDIRSVAEETNFIRQYWGLLIGRFRGAAQFASEAKLGKDVRVKINGNKIECYDVKIETEKVKDELWVDQDKFIVWHFKQTPRAGAPLGTIRTATVTIDFTRAEFNVPLDETVFKFVAPVKSSKVDELKWPENSGR